MTDCVRRFGETEEKNVTVKFGALAIVNFFTLVGTLNHFFSSFVYFIQKKMNTQQSKKSDEILPTASSCDRFQGLSAREVHSELLAEHIREQNRRIYAQSASSLKDDEDESPGKACLIL